MQMLRKLALAVAMALPAAGVSAATIDFDSASLGTHTNYVEDGFVFDKVRVVRAHCDNDSKPCAAENQFRDSTLSLLTGGLFNLGGMWISLINTTPITLVTDKGSLDFGVGSMVGSDTIVAKKGYTLDLSANGIFQNISFLKIVDITLGQPGTGVFQGNLRFDDIDVTPAPVPLPAAGLLLVAGMGGLAALRRRKRA